jgi:hypothetical protein
LRPKSPMSADAPSSFLPVRCCSTGRSPAWSVHQPAVALREAHPSPCCRPPRARSGLAGVRRFPVLGARARHDSHAAPYLAVVGLLRALARRPSAASLRSAAAGKYRARLRLDPSPRTLARINQGRREVRDTEPDLRRPSPSPEGHLCAIAAWGRVGRLGACAAGTLLFDSGRPFHR